MNLLLLLSLKICECSLSRHPQQQQLLLVPLMQKKLDKLKTLKHKKKKKKKIVRRSSLLSLLCVCVSPNSLEIQALQKFALMALISCHYNTCNYCAFSRRIGLEIVTILPTHRIFPLISIYEKSCKENLSTQIFFFFFLQAN